MIRPLTIATCLLASGSGLYLYQSKHEVQLLDRTIERTVHDTAALREQSRLLAAEWTMLNDPERLRKFSDAYLHLKTITPSQFTSLTDLDTRLPPPRAEVPSHGTDEQEVAPVATEIAPRGALDPVPQTVPDSGPAADAVAEEALPVPPVPATPRAPAVASVARPAELKGPDRVAVSRPAVAESQARPTAVADARLADQRPSVQRPPEQRAVPRVAGAHVEARVAVAPVVRPTVLAAPRPVPVSARVNAAPVPPRPAMVAASVPYAGSLLGMARGSVPPAPRPAPVNASYNAN